MTAAQAPALEGHLADAQVVESAQGDSNGRPSSSLRTNHEQTRRGESRPAARRDVDPTHSSAAVYGCGRFPVATSSPSCGVICWGFWKPWMPLAALGSPSIG